MIRQKNTKVFWHQSEARITPAVWNWSVKTLSPGALLRLLDFFSPKFFLNRFDFFPPPLTAPGSPRMGTTRLPGTTLFWLQKAKYDHNTDKISKLRPIKHQVLSQFVHFCFENKLFSSFVICSCVGLQGHRSVTSVKLSRAVGLPYLKILLVNPGYLLTLLLGLPWQ